MHIAPGRACKLVLGWRHTTQGGMPAMSKFIAPLVLVLSMLVSSACMAQNGGGPGRSQVVPSLNIPLPANITIDMKKPEQGVPPEFAAFAGKWGGLWNGQLPSNVIVESVSKTGEAR